MKAMNLLADLEFHAPDPYAQPLNIDVHGRILRFMLKPGQSIRKHKVPNSPFFVVVVQGKGVFVGADQVEQQVGPNTLLAFEPDEEHSVRALDEELVFVGFLHRSPGTRADRSLGVLADE